MPTGLPFHPTLGILQAARTLIEGLQLPDASGPLFQAVKLYDSADIDKAFADTLVSREQRICFIIPGRTDYVREVDGRTMVIRKYVEFACLICDTDRLTGVDAVFGGANNTGTIALADLLVEALSGEHLGFHNVCLEPDGGDEMSVTKEGDSDPGRKGWFQSFRTAAGKKGVGIYG
jgi:hypothetical protein